MLHIWNILFNIDVDSLFCYNAKLIILIRAWYLNIESNISLYYTKH